jgi:hypothetical protein
VQRIEDDVGLRGVQHGRKIGTGVDFLDPVAFLPQRRRTFGAGDERHFALGRPAALEDRDAG